MPPEALFSPKRKEEILGTDNFTPEKGWFVPRDGLPTLDSLPSLYCQITLKEYHVTERVSLLLNKLFYFLFLPPTSLGQLYCFGTSTAYSYYLTFEKTIFSPTFSR